MHCKVIITITITTITYCTKYLHIANLCLIKIFFWLRYCDFFTDDRKIYNYVQYKEQVVKQSSLLSLLTCELSILLLNTCMYCQNCQQELIIVGDRHNIIVYLAITEHICDRILENIPFGHKEIFLRKLVLKIFFKLIFLHIWITWLV